MPQSDFVGIRIKTCFIKIPLLLAPSDFQRFHRLCDALEDKVCLRIARFSYLNVSLSVPKDTFSAINFN